MRIYMLYAKSDHQFFRTAVGMLKFQLENVYEFEDNDRLMRVARAVVAADDENRALRLLGSRRSYEYENWETYELQD